MLLSARPATLLLATPLLATLVTANQPSIPASPSARPAAATAGQQPSMHHIDATLAKAEQAMHRLDGLIASEQQRVERLRGQFAEAPDPATRAQLEQMMLDASRLERRLRQQRDDMATLIADLQAQLHILRQMPEPDTNQPAETQAAP
jgi:ABC-type phosphate transport system auxiliary subunit